MRWIRRQDTEFISGRVAGTIKVTSRTIIAMGMDSCMMAREDLAIAASGRVGRRVSDR